jgi:hypothetical protein
MKFFKPIIINIFKIIYYKIIIHYYKLLQNIFQSYPLYYNTTNNPPSKLGQAWISQLKTIYDKNDK